MERRAASELRDVRLSGGVRNVLAVGCGLLSVLAFPGFDLWPLAFVAFVPLVVAIEGQPAGRAFRLGWLAGLSGTLIGFHWLAGTLHRFGGLPWPLCLLLMLLLCGYQSGRFGLQAWLCARVSARGWPLPIAFAAAFVASELAWPLLLPWAVAAMLHDVPVLVQAAELGGPIAVGLPLVCANLAVAVWFVGSHDRLSRLRWSLGLGAPLLATLAFGVWRMPRIDEAVASAPGARVGIVQANIAAEAKAGSGDMGLRRHLALTRELIRRGPLDLVVWSETAMAEPLPEAGAAAHVRARLAGGLGAPVLFGAVLYRPIPDGRRLVLFNSALLADARGGLLGRYDKQRLMPFSEKLPFAEAVPALRAWLPASGRFASSASDRPLRFGEHEIATFICYEDVMPDLVRSLMTDAGSALLVNLTNDAWFGDSTAPAAHLAMARLRAVEQRRFFVRSTNSGISAVVDPVGRLLLTTASFTPESRVAEVRWLSGRTIYQRWGDRPWWLLTLALASTALWPRRSVRRVGGERPDARLLADARLVARAAEPLQQRSSGVVIRDRQQHAGGARVDAVAGLQPLSSAARERGHHGEALATVGQQDALEAGHGLGIRDQQDRLHGRLRRGAPPPRTRAAPACGKPTSQGSCSSRPTGRGSSRRRP